MKKPDQDPEPTYGAEPNPKAYASAVPWTREFYKINGNPLVMVLSEAQMARVVAMAMEIAIEAAGKKWK